MPNRNAEKGARWERAIRAFLTEWWPPMKVVRPHQEGFLDVGDLHLDPVVIQAKDVAGLNVSGWLTDVEAQRKNAGGRWGVVVWKRRGKGAKDGVVFMTLETFRDMVGVIRGDAVVRSTHEDEDAPSGG